MTTRGIARSLGLAALGLGLVATLGSGPCLLAETVAAKPAPAPTAKRVRAEGRIVAHTGYEVTLGTELGGTLARVLVAEKSRVKKGEVLAELSSDEQAAAVDEATARVAEAD